MPVTDEAIPFCARCHEPFASGQLVIQVSSVSRVSPYRGATIVTPSNVFAHLECPVR